VWLVGCVVIGAGFGLLTAVGYVAKRVFLSGSKTLGRLIASTRWPVWITAVNAGIGSARHLSARTLAWQETLAFAAALLGIYSYVIVKATYRTHRILRSRRAGTLP
jgi:hypothetical protein